MIPLNTEENKNNIFLILSCYSLNAVTSSFYIKNKNIGTGNILFQIASLLNYAHKHNATLFVPCLNTYFHLENVKKENTIYRLICTDIPENYNESNTIDLLSISDFYIFNQPFYNNMHMKGYFENFNNFDENRSIILNHFRPSEEDKQYILEKYPIIKNDNISSIHIRMGPDIMNYYSIDHIKLLECTYHELINHMIQHKNVETFMVFTNDKSYCETFLNNNDKYKNIQFIYSEEVIDYFDIWIISIIKNNIISFSTFSLWGSYLNENQDKYIVGSNKIVKEKLKYPEWVYI